ncbi:transcript variant X2 [Nothobranchius furzeri]|uniref:Interleukin-18 receptor accessory protein-like n=1 Tax=Nothobranchius furzeri TaxID=105023 RepID=A0A8C6KNY0_NOTFU|nr:transcript variant X2 [Nothobranchius furzeri]
MQTECVLLYFIFPVITNGCCMKSPQKEMTGPLQNQNFRVVEGEIFMMPCNKSNKSVMWSRNKDDKKEKKHLSFNCTEMFITEVEHSGIYKSQTGSILTLQVMEKTSLGCYRPSESSRILLAFAGGMIKCPGHTCSNNTDVVWYKRNKAVSKERRESCEEMEHLQLCTVDVKDDTVFFCDRKIIEQGVMWSFRRAVNVTVIPHLKARTPPKITYPLADVIEEVVLGRPHNLTCKADFDFEVNISRKVQWFMSQGDNMENMTLLHTERPQESRDTFRSFKVIQIANIKEVTTHHLNHMYTCVASNTVGNSSVTTRLKQKKQVKWPSLLGYPIACFLLVAGLGITLRVKWLEVQLICRSHFLFGTYRKEDTDFDVFLSHVWKPSSSEVERDLFFSTISGPYHDAEECLSSVEMLGAAEANATQRPIEVMLTEVIEDQWRYRLCLLERDLLPGGAYTDDVVMMIKRSRTLICVLSADYLTDSNAVFVLDAGIKALLQDSALKLLLVWTNGASASHIHPDLPLPKLVQRALKVLPSLDWCSDTSSADTSRFWTSLRRILPKD